MLKDRLQTAGKVGVGLIALMFLLAYNFVHTGSLLASHLPADLAWIGYMAAAGIELSVVALARQIGLRKNNAQDTGFFYFVLGMVVLVSALANASEGFLARYGNEPTIDAIKSIDPFQFIVWVTATALISLIVVSLSEILGQDLESAAQNPSGVERCPNCDYKVEWPTEKHQNRKSAKAAITGHSKVHRSQ